MMDKVQKPRNSLCYTPSSQSFRKYISLIEKDNISATEVAMKIGNLVNSLESRKSEAFVTTDVKKQLKMLVDLGDINEVKFFEVVENSYETSLQYANKWKCSLENTEKFKYVLWMVEKRSYSVSYSGL
jgi:hypothetical protein